MTVVRSRRAGISAEEARQRPMYAKVLGLQYLRPSNLLCFAFFEGAIVLAALLALAELADWWVVLILPLTVAAMVKLNDVIAGAVLRTGSDRAPKALGRAAVPGAAARGAVTMPGAGARAWPRRSTRIPPGTATDDSNVPTSSTETDEWLGSPGQRARQSAMRRYE